MTNHAKTDGVVSDTAVQSVAMTEERDNTANTSVLVGSLDGTDGAEPRIYELGYLIVPAVSEGNLPREVATIKDTLDAEKVAVISEEFPKWRALAYPMRKRTSAGYATHESGYFGWVKFEASAQSAARIEHECKQNPQILRYLFIKTVREHTLTGGRPRIERREKRGPPHVAQTSTPVSEIELDKSIEKLIAE
ncbi:MAG: hypothetical protein A2W52_03665 [Candidatus Taylorbacteria bacterium RIFCSPHIGHO2_02_49_25]|uniref:Small ribosomal subunit protein bS6 n=1 Tax=Candidatus Taylorbacteria bacterium RIFCSPHIGHO2_02_49_25 TaxID=1802305 RepID=A0A1G2MH68_9BACT|nr:MAG: hypothetical protein UY62_C0059G0014 [Parcubacteria group bacterium GW2011_GWF2_50_9]OHA21301.1 MAG: hypothetical protein A2759_00880 [Candidatus Taylorbacteria bacterium RIFCSPHIGHO2_01_FULL_49_60]OHA22519.1 MAG: hypothetical protein A2W52_03665 [Candidatus Taylorbacteria bacterium RIFCSPHIGHO2_02_49_25]OHA36410.1 MAG: hypothetical protein A3B27_00530 [Candidatus Taylorbacteria bacterium RIFCSPLOWO2_01_FULL_50_130]OHA36714.1 MAG: hypothetical protein A2W65_01785 [Candidatus Taylorbacte